MTAGEEGAIFSYPLNSADWSVAPESRGLRAAGSGKRICNRREAAEWVRSLPDIPDNGMIAIYVDQAFNLLGHDQLGRGNAVECGLKPYLLVRRGLDLGAAAFILVHHSPARISRVQQAEIDLTSEIRRAGNDFEVHLLDHLILGANGEVRDVP